MATFRGFRRRCDDISGRAENDVVATGYDHQKRQTGQPNGLREKRRIIEFSFVEMNFADYHATLQLWRRSFEHNYL